MSDPAYRSWASKKDMEQAFAEYGDAISNQMVTRGSYSSYRRDYSDLTNDLSGRPGLNQSDFDWFRPQDRVPTKPKDIIGFARYAYRRIGLIRNSIDLMGDFACQGVRLAHRNKRVENFYKDWFNRIDGQAVSERLCNLLFREANVVIKSKTAKINAKKRLEMQRAVASPDMQPNFLDPMLIEIIGGPLASLTDKTRYAIKVPATYGMQLSHMTNNPNIEMQKILSEIPVELKRAIQDQKPIPLDPDKTFVYYYKKDDWQGWADPMTYACFRDLILYEKLKLADQAALDGAISKIRVWKLGSLDHKLAPTQTASQALESILGANVQGGTKDIIWGPDIELIETSTDVQSFLGEEKYRPTLMAIYAALGIPPTLTGTFGASGTTNNFISLKTLTERLNYVRTIVSNFWEEQVKIVQKAMGFRYPAVIEFDYMNLEDPSSIMNILLSMADRNILSDEYLQRYIKANPDMEIRRTTNENNRKDEKVSPFHQADQDFQMKKITLQTGLTSPSEVGLELNEKKKGEDSVLSIRSKDAKQKARNQGGVQGRPQENVDTGAPGRPKNATDTGPRQERTFKPALKASIQTWARDAQFKIAEFINPGILEQYTKGNMRSLTAEEFEQAEEVKFNILMNLEPFADLTLENMGQAMSKAFAQTHSRTCKEWIDDTGSSLDRKLSIDEIRNIRASYYADFYVSK
jgi:hypothetical protein